MNDPLLGRVHSPASSESGYTPILDKTRPGEHEPRSRMSDAARRALYYESPVPARADAPRLLIIIFNFPPDPAVGGLRWQEMGRYLAHQGWAVDVVTRDLRNVEQADPARLSRLDIGARVFSVTDREPWVGRVQRMVWPLVRAVLPARNRRSADALSQSEVFGPQGARAVVRAYHARVEFTRDRIWARAAGALASSIIGRTPYQAIISSGPPHMAHEAGRIASVRTGVPHVVDMRDPWSLVQRLREEVASPLWVRLARSYERGVIAHAKLVTMNTPAARDAMRAAYPKAAQRIEVIRNGSDDEPLPAPHRDGCFRLRFAGGIYMDRDPRLVFRAARNVIDALGLTTDQFMIEFVGHANKYANTPTSTIAAEEGVADYVRVSGQLPRAKALEFLAGATMLLSLPQDSDFAIPAKIYEYVRFHAWMLVLASATSATAELLRDSDADVVEPSDVEAMTAILTQRYRQFAAGQMPEPVGRTGRFDRSVQADRLIGLLETRLEAAGPRPALAEGISA